MADAAPPRPEGGASRAWVAGVWSLACVGLVAGLFASAGEGLLRRAMLLAVLAAALGLAALTGTRRLQVPEHSMGGPGYTVPRHRRVQAVHVLLTLMYNVGIFVVVLAALVRSGVAGGSFDAGLLRDFPTFLGTYVFLLAVATKWRVDEIGGVLHSWSTRVHGIFLAILSVPIAALAAAILVWHDLDLGGFTLVEADVLVLSLAGILGVGTQLFLAVNLPTIFDLGRLVRKPKGPSRAAPAETPPILYALLVAVGGALIVGFVLARLDVVGQLGGFRNERVILLLVLFPVALAIFFLFSAWQIWRESRRGLYKRRLPPKLRNALLLYALCGLAGLGLTALLVMNLLGNLPPWWPLHQGRELSKDLTVLTILATAGPIGWHLSRRNRNVDAIEERLPDFLNDLAETRRAGLTMAAALQSVALSDYGALTPEIKKMALQVSWGIPFTEALSQFAQRVPTGLVMRSSSLIIEASKTGGSVAEILKAAARDAYEIKALEADRRVAMLTYMIVIYVVFFVFMTVIAVLDARFLPQVIAANEAVKGTESEQLKGFIGGAQGIDREGLRFVYFNASIVQAIGNGLVGGVLSEGRVSAGLRHVALMSVTAWILFRLLLAL